MNLRRMAQVFMCLAVACAVSCSPSNSGKSKPLDSKPTVEDKSLTVEAYLQLGIPSPDRMWTPADYSQAVSVLKTIAAKTPKELPRYQSTNSGKVFSRITSRENLAAMLNKNLPLDSRLPLAIGYLEGVTQTLMLYLKPSTQELFLDAELVEVMGLMLKVEQEALGLANEFRGSLPKDDPKMAVRLEGFAKMKNGVVTTFDGALLSLGETNVYRTTSRIKLCGYLQETLPAVIADFPSTVQTEIPIRLKRLQTSASTEEMKKSLESLQKTIVAALAH